MTQCGFNRGVRSCPFVRPSVCPPVRPSCLVIESNTKHLPFCQQLKKCPVLWQFMLCVNIFSSMSLLWNRKPACISFPKINLTP